MSAPNLTIFSASVLGRCMPMPHRSVISFRWTPAASSCSRTGGTSRESGLERVISVNTMQTLSPGPARSRSGGEATGTSSHFRSSAGTSSMGGRVLDSTTWPRKPDGSLNCKWPLPKGTLNMRCLLCHPGKGILRSSPIFFNVSSTLGWSGMPLACRSASFSYSFSPWM